MVLEEDAVLEEDSGMEIAEEDNPTNREEEAPEGTSIPFEEEDAKAATDVPRLASGLTDSLQPRRRMERATAEAKSFFFKMTPKRDPNI
jgi:hypothetical protein